MRLGLAWAHQVKFAEEVNVVCQAWLLHAGLLAIMENDLLEGEALCLRDPKVTVCRVLNRHHFVEACALGKKNGARALIQEISLQDALLEDLAIHWEIYRSGPEVAAVHLASGFPLRDWRLYVKAKSSRSPHYH